MFAVTLVLGTAALTFIFSGKANASDNQVYTYNAQGDINNARACAPAKAYGSLSTPIVAVDNEACNVRIWLEKSGKGAFTLCISPGDYETVLPQYQKPSLLGVSSNTAACP
jgi:hypothetical protein